MNLKLIVASRLESLTKDGPRVNVVLVGEQVPGMPMAKLEIGNLNDTGGTQFPLGRQIEITVPTYTNNRLILTPDQV